MIVQNEHKNRGVGLGSEDDNKETGRRDFW